MLLVQSEMQSPAGKITIRYKSKFLYMIHKTLSLIMSSASFLTTYAPHLHPSLLYTLQLYPSSLEHTRNSHNPWPSPVNASLLEQTRKMSLFTSLTLAHLSVPS